MTTTSTLYFYSLTLIARDISQFCIECKKKSHLMFKVIIDNLQSLQSNDYVYSYDYIKTHKTLLGYF